MGQYDINRQESPTTHILPPPTEEVWSQQEDPHTVLSGSYWECADILNQYLVWQCQCSWPKTTWWPCQGCIKTHGLWTAVTGVHLHHTDPAQSKMHHRRWTASCSLPSPMSAIWEALQDYQSENSFCRTIKARTCRFKQFLPQSSRDCVPSALNHHTVIFWPTQCKSDDPDHSVCCSCCCLCKQNVCTAKFTSTAFCLLLSSPILLFLVLTFSLHFYKIFNNTSSGSGAVLKGLAITAWLLFLRRKF